MVERILYFIHKLAYKTLTVLDLGFLGFCSKWARCTWFAHEDGEGDHVGCRVRVEGEDEDARARRTWLAPGMEKAMIILKLKQQKRCRTSWLDW